MFFVFITLTFVYHLIMSGIAVLIKDRVYYGNDIAIISFISACILNIFGKSFIYILFVDVFISPLLPFELVVPYWNMVLARVAFWFLTLKISTKE